MKAMTQGAAKWRTTLLICTETPPGRKFWPALSPAQGRHLTGGFYSDRGGRKGRSWPFRRAAFSTSFRCLSVRSRRQVPYRLMIPIDELKAQPEESVARLASPAEIQRRWIEEPVFRSTNSFSTSTWVDRSTDCGRSALSTARMSRLSIGFTTTLFRWLILPLQTSSATVRSLGRGAFSSGLPVGRFGRGDFGW
jgi:hypothetical protein